MTDPPAAPAGVAEKTSARPSDLDAALIAAMAGTIPRYLRAMRHAITQAEGPGRLTMPQVLALRAIAATETRSALTTHLARRLSVAVPTMTSMIDGLVERGLVERRPDPASRRQVRLVMMDAGWALLRHYEALMDTRLAELLTPLTTLQKERLLAAMTDLASMLDADDAADGAHATAREDRSR